MASFAEASPGDPQAGEKIFESKCAQRLAIEKGAGHKQGPNGLFGRQTGATADYSYSAANNNMAVIWDESSLYDCLLNPKKVIPHERLSSTSQVNAHKQTVQYNEYDIDQPKLQPQSFSTVGRGARRTNRMGAGSLIGSSGSISFPEEKLLMPSSPPRISLRRPVSPPIVRSIDGTPTSIPGRVSSSHPGSAYAPGRVGNGNGNGNGWLDQRRLPNEDPQPLEAYTLYNLHKGYGRKHPRDLIDAYGNPENSSYEKFAKAQRLDGNGTASVAAAGEWRNSDEEEYAWEDMSPTLADRSRGNCIPPFGPNSGSFSVQTGFSSPNPSLMESDFVRHSWPGEAQRRTADGSSHIVEDRIASHGSQARLMMKSLDGPSVHSESLSRRDTGKSTYILRQSTQQNLRSRSQSRVAQMLPATRGLDDNSIDMDLARRGLSNAQTDSLKMVTSMMDRNSTQRHPSTPATLPPVHVSQSLSLHTVATQSPIRSLDVSEPNKSTLIQGAHQPIFMPEQQYNVTVKKNSDSVELLHMGYQQSVFPYVNQHGKEQRIPLPVQSQETYQSILTPARMQLSSYSTGQSLNLQPRLGSGVALPSDLPSSFATPAAVHSTTDTLVHSNLLPPLPSGSLPASSHLLQNLSSSISGSPASALSGLISSLMAQGLISLNSHSQAQDSLGVDFNLDLLKVRHESVINSLYADLPRQCTTCGLRFKCQEEHSSHMDWHVTKNRISKNRKQKPSRKWFVSAKEWLSGAETLGNDVVPGFLPTESITEKKEDKDVAVPADENQKVCALCGETFEDFYSDEMEEWMYKGAVYLNAPDGYTEGLDRCQLGPIVHAKCRSESNESQQV